MMMGGGSEDFSQAVRLLKRAAEQSETGESDEEKRDAAVAVAQSMRHFEAALEGTRASTLTQKLSTSARCLPPARLTSW